MESAAKVWRPLLLLLLQALSAMLGDISSSLVGELMAKEPRLLLVRGAAGRWQPAAPPRLLHWLQGHLLLSTPDPYNPVTQHT